MPHRRERAARDAQEPMDTERSERHHEDGRPELQDSDGPAAAAQETDERAVSAGSDGDSSQGLLRKLEDAEARAQKAEKDLLYARAEFETTRRRMEERAMENQRYATQELVKNLLPVIDNFERALKAARENSSLEALVAGVEGTERQLRMALEKAGVKTIPAAGEPFDPRVHEAIGHAEETDLPANTVAEEVQRGYTMHDRVLRPALVKVANG